AAVAGVGDGLRSDAVHAVLARQHEVVPVGAQELAEQLLGFAGLIVLGGVDERAAGFGESVEDLAGLGGLGAGAPAATGAPAGAEVGGAEAVLGHAQAVVAPEGRVSHGWISPKTSKTSNWYCVNVDAVLDAHGRATTAATASRPGWQVGGSAGDGHDDVADLGPGLETTVGRDDVLQREDGVDDRSQGLAGNAVKNPVDGDLAAFDVGGELEELVPPQGQALVDQPHHRQ